ncbi:MAG: hypothetical protein KatS3mg090_0879 [Patescibacteria group bacterium]|nr:MAG: hypothetical protein KatS3mg090_0879 [Patescibacteria group bacterium]
MPIKVYVKEYYSTKKKVINFVSYILLSIGLIMLFWAVYPIITFELFSKLLVQKNFVSPVPSSTLASSLEIASDVLGSKVTMGTNLKGFTNANLWFPKVKADQELYEKPKQDLTKIKEYSLSIPKLDITSAKVIVGGEDLNQGLVHYMPKSLPGEEGNVVVFGHSTLPQLFKKGDYKSIFTYLHTLQKGDEIIVKVDDHEYTYEVTEMFIINPDQIEILEQVKDESILTLVTCTPPGTYWKRLVVKAKLKTLPLEFDL